MRILKILFVILAIYFIRRFIQMYRVMKNIQEQQAQMRREQQQYGDPKAPPKNQKIVDADYKVIRDS